MQNKEVCEEKSVNEKNLEIFNRYFPGCLSMENDNKLTLDTEKLKALLGDFSGIKEEGYGLNFVGKKIALTQAFKKNDKILKPLNKSTSKHILIKGDNLDALKILRQSYSEKIKMIYIDPPYNTKNENFIYSDDFSQSNETLLKQLDYSKEKLDYINNLFGSKCHSGWLSFMYPRLLLAKDLLKKDGVIFISIDDNEAAQLKLLCDEIFGEGNFVAQFIIQHNPRGRSLDKILAQTHEYCVCYCKDITAINPFLIAKNENGIAEYNKSDENGLYREMRLMNGNRNFTRNERPNLYFPLYVNVKTNKVATQKSDEFTQEVLPINSFGSEQCWTWSKTKIEKENDLIIARKNSNGEWRIFRKDYLSDISSLTKTKTLFVDKTFNNENGTETIRKLFGKDVFSTPKPIEMIIYLLNLVMSANSGDIILDFFAGSGTTAHAVLESNKSDYQKLSEGGGLFNGLNAAFKERRFILVQLDEKIDPNKNKSAHDFCLNTLKSTSPSIFDITEERIKRAGAKIKETCPHLDTHFQAFEIIDDEMSVIYHKNLGEVGQEDLFAYSNPKKREIQTILINLLWCEGLELTTPITCLIENALYLAENTAFIVGDIEMNAVLENLKDKGVEKISMYMPAISNDNLYLELSSNLNELHLEINDLKSRG
ncbi:site-specific DNA-methyltransferase [Helicobacter pylori]|uniref:site-specific DNA-methyltransferase n=1 Tax=Helicobacter pylori TaxID=210 RepID=UPI0003F65103|nr:site-specific DNA-methyltransferase [Helicobacter pylori]